jgi:choice-of-anchor C domain-containing protein
MKLIAVASLLAGMALAGAASATNLVQDGNFNMYNLPGTGLPNSFVTYSAGTSFGLTDTTGPWKVTNGSVDYIGGYWNGPTAGTGSVDLDGNAPGGISQTISTVIGQTYALTFDLSGNPDGLPQTKSVSVDLNGSSTPSGIFTYTVPGTVGLPGANHDLLYNLETVDFTATGTSTELAFLSNSPSGPGDTGFFGPVIGNVSVSAAPEPATWALMIIGVGMAGGALRLSRKSREAGVPALA